MIYVALLRGINVGGNNKIEMKKLKTIFESLGFTKVTTYINSGNVIFETDDVDCTKLTNLIEVEISKNFGFLVRVTIRTLDQIIELCNLIPTEWTNDKDQKTDILFLWDEVDSTKITSEIKINTVVDNLQYFENPKVVAWNIQKANYSKSGMVKFIGTKIYKNMTARNVNTVRKLQELMQV